MYHMLGCGWYLIIDSKPENPGEIKKSGQGGEASKAAVLALVSARNQTGSVKSFLWRFCYASIHDPGFAEARSLRD